MQIETRVPDDLLKDAVQQHDGAAGRKLSELMSAVKVQRGSQTYEFLCKGSLTDAAMFRTL